MLYHLHNLINLNNGAIASSECLKSLLVHEATASHDVFKHRAVTGDEQKFVGCVTETCHEKSNCFGKLSLKIIFRVQ